MILTVESRGSLSPKIRKPVVWVSLVGAIALCLGLRYYYVFHYSGFRNCSIVEPPSDDSYYLMVAYSLARTGRHGYPRTGPRGDIEIDKFAIAAVFCEKQLLPVTSVRPTATRLPLWPLVLAVMAKVAQYDIRWIFYLRFLLDAATLLLFHRLLVYLQIGGLARPLAVLGLAVHPAWLTYSAVLFSEPLTLLLHMALFVNVVAFVDREASLARACVIGVLAGACVLAHPYYALLPIVLVGACYVLKLVSGRRFLLIASVAAIVVAPWFVRNALLFGQMKPIFATVSGLQLAKGWNSKFLGDYRNMKDPKEDVDAGNVDTTGMNALEVSDVYAGLAARFVRQNWRLVPAIVARKLVAAVNPVAEMPPQTILDWTAELGRILAFGPVVWILTRRRSARLRLLALATIATYLIVSVLTFPQFRYRFPLVWIEVVGVSVALDAFARGAGSWFRKVRLQSRGRRPGHSRAARSPVHSVQRR